MLRVSRLERCRVRAVSRSAKRPSGAATRNCSAVSRGMRPPPCEPPGRSLARTTGSRSAPRPNNSRVSTDRSNSTPCDSTRPPVPGSPAWGSAETVAMTRARAAVSRPVITVIIGWRSSASLSSRS